MQNKTVRNILASLLVSAVVVAPSVLNAQQPDSQPVDGISVIGSVILSVLHVPLKLVTCVGTQTGAAVAYTTTFGVPGNYDGGTNGKHIGEVANRSCTGDWIITPQHVHYDYQ